MSRDKEWGVVQTLVVEADTHTALLAAVTIALTANSQITHWGYDGNALVLFWSIANGSHLLPSPIKDSEKIASLIEDWLRDIATYPKEPDTDGNTKKGYRVEIGHNYVTCKITPTWIIYGK